MKLALPTVIYALQQLSAILATLAIPQLTMGRPVTPPAPLPTADNVPPTPIVHHAQLGTILAIIQLNVFSHAALRTVNIAKAIATTALSANQILNCLIGNAIPVTA